MANRNPDTQGQWLRIRFFILFFYLMCVIPYAFHGAISTLQSSSSSPLDWVDDDYKPRQEYDQFRELFGDGDLLIASWKGCQIDDPRLDDLKTSLQNDAEFRTPDGKSYFREVKTGRDLINQLAQPPLALPSSAAIELLKGKAIGPDLKTTMVTMQFNLHGLQQRNQLVPLISQKITQYCHVTRAEQFLAGPVMDGYMVDQASSDTMRQLAPVSAIVVLCLCLIFVESTFAGFLIFCISLLAQLTSLALVYYSKSEMTALLIVLPPLMQVLSVAGGLHLVHYYLATIQNTQTDYFSAAATTIKENWIPFALSALTTAIGMFSLALSDVSAVRSFGILSATSVIINWCLICFLLPGLLAFSKVRTRHNRYGKEEKAPLLFRGLLRVVSSHATALSLAAIFAMFILGYGLPNLNASVRIETLFSKNSRLVQSYAWIEKNVGLLVPIEITLTFPNTSNWSYDEKLNLTREVADELKSHSAIQNTFSSNDILGPLVDRFCFENQIPNSSPARTEVIHSIAQNSIPTLELMHFLSWNRQDEEVWRLTAFTSALDDTQYNVLLEQLKNNVSKLVTSNSSESQASPTFSIAGIMPLVHDIQQQLLDDLFASFLSAFLIIYAVLVLAMGSWTRAFVAMIPNIFPIIILFGALGWSGSAIDIGTVMTASIAIGIAVDDTLHFLAMFEKGIQQGLNRKESVEYVYKYCGSAILNTTIACVGGMAVFSFSNFIPTARFSWMMAGLLAIAVVGDLILLPALLISPLGRIFESKRH